MDENLEWWVEKRCSGICDCPVSTRDGSPWFPGPVALCSGPERSLHLVRCAARQPTLTPHLLPERKSQQWRRRAVAVAASLRRSLQAGSVMSQDRALSTPCAVPEHRLPTPLSKVVPGLCGRWLPVQVSPRVRRKKCDMMICFLVGLNVPSGIF